MNIVFFGTPDLAKNFLAALHADEEILISAVVTQPDKPVGRKQIMTPSPVKAYAKEQHLTVLTPTYVKENEELLATLRALKPDIFVIIAYGFILPKELLAIPAKGCVNVHPSLLPKYRGPSPLQAVIYHREQKTGVSIMLIDEKMDHGPILAQQELTLAPDETPETLEKKVIEIGSPLLIDAVKKYIAGDLKPQEQQHDKATYCKLLRKEDGKIDWHRSAEEIEAQIRAYTPWPGTFTFWQGKRLKIHKAALVQTDTNFSPGEVAVQENTIWIGTETTPIHIDSLQLEGKPVMNARTFLNGHKNFNGSQVE